jgi:hypothetical protein
MYPNPAAVFAKCMQVANAAMMMPIASGGSSPLVQAWLQLLCWGEGQRSAELTRRNSRLPPSSQAWL